MAQIAKINKINEKTKRYGPEFELIQVFILFFVFGRTNVFIYDGRILPIVFVRTPLGSQLIWWLATIVFYLVAGETFLNIF